jgi:hypothetical protein
MAKSDRQSFDPYKDPDGTMGAFYIETPCANMEFHDFRKSETWKKLKEDEINGELTKRHPGNPYVQAQAEVRGIIGEQVYKEAFVCKADEDGSIEIPADMAEFARQTYEMLVARFGASVIKLHRKSLPLQRPRQPKSKVS